MTTTCLCQTPCEKSSKFLFCILICLVSYCMFSLAPVAVLCVDEYDIHNFIFGYIGGRHAVKTQLSYLLANSGTLANSYMFWPLHRPSSGCTSYYKVWPHCPRTVFMMTTELTWVHVTRYDERYLVINNRHYVYYTGCFSQLLSILGEWYAIEKVHSSM
jgi:hypothetical protein